MEVTVALPVAELNALYNGYTSQGGGRPRREVIEVLAQNIIDRYFSPKYFDQNDVLSVVESLLD